MLNIICEETDKMKLEVKIKDINILKEKLNTFGNELLAGISKNNNMKNELSKSFESHRNITFILMENENKIKNQRNVHEIQSEQGSFKIY